MNAILVSMGSFGTLKTGILTAIFSIFLSSTALTPYLANNVSIAQTSSYGEVHSDFNGDGHEDLVIWVPGEIIDGVNNAGAISVIYGSSSSGLQTSAPGDQLWHQNKPGVEDSVEEDNQFGDQFGRSLAPGDFNGDGFGDLAVGVPGESLGAVENAGAVNVLYGSSLGLRSTPVVDGSGRADQLWSQNSPDVNDAAQEGDVFGSSLASGDFNGDGYDDLAIGVPSERVTSEGLDSYDEGAVHVIFGSEAGLQTTSPVDQFWTQNSPGVEDAVEPNEHFGSTLDTGDFNGDGYGDLVIAVPTQDVDNETYAGAVHVLYGSSSGLQTSSPADQFWHRNVPGVEGTASFVDYFGNSMDAGDFNGDGYGDIAIGIRDGYAVNILYGSNLGLGVTGDQIFTVSTKTPQYSGWSVLAAGDFNGDDRDDLAIGISEYDFRYKSNVGAVQVLHGTSSGLVSVAGQFWTQNVAGVEDSAYPGEFFGRSIAENDFNGDGKDDLAIGVNEYVAGFWGAGAINVLYGSSSGLQADSPADQFWHQNSPGVEDSAEFGDDFGTGLA